MKLKQEFLVSALAGLAAGILRFIQYFTTIDEAGYYKPGTLSTVLNGVLLGFLGIGLLWGVLCSVYRKQNLTYTNLFHNRSWMKGIFGILGCTVAAEGAYLLATAGAAIQRIGALLILIGAISWILLAAKGNHAPGFAAFFSVLQVGVSVLLYFWNTYKFIHVSEYALVLLGLCSICLLALLILKALAGAECTRGRSNAAACFVLTFGFTSFIAPLAHAVTFNGILRAIEGICFMALAAAVLNPVPNNGANTPRSVPDLSQMKEYISDIPEVEEE